MRNNGFTLIELAIVLIIISLIVVGIVSGQSLIRTAKINSVISDVESYGSAVNVFRKKYHSWPGDMPDAVSYWGGSTANGDGDDMVEVSGEELRAWQHLSASEMVVGAYAGTGDYTLKTNLPASQLPAGAFLLIYNNTAISGKQGNHFEIGAISGTTAINNSILTPTEARSIDLKIDDGLALGGKVMTLEGSNATTEDCLSGGVYNLSKENIACRMIFWLE